LPAAYLAAADLAADTGFAQFQAAAARGNLVPVYARLFADQLTPVTAYRCLVAADDREAPSFLFESVVNGTQQARRRPRGQPRLSEGDSGGLLGHAARTAPCLLSHLAPWQCSVGTPSMQACGGGGQLRARPRRAASASWAPSLRWRSSRAGRRSRCSTTSRSSARRAPDAPACTVPRRAEGLRSHAHGARCAAHGSGAHHAQAARAPALRGLVPAIPGRACELTLRMLLALHLPSARRGTLP